MLVVIVFCDVYSNNMHKLLCTTVDVATNAKTDPTEFNDLLRYYFLRYRKFFTKVEITGAENDA
jgi:hypothetical protein